MQIKKIRQNILVSIGNIILAPMLDIWCRTLRISFQNDDAFENLNKKGCIIAFWHGDMLIPWFIHRNKNVTALVSTSKDGGLLVKILNKWKYNVIRGSSNKGGKEALLEMIEIAKLNKTIAITPDGPKGPGNVMKPGAIITSVRTGNPIVLVAAAASKVFQFNSWDKFKIPKPFTKVSVIYSEPLFFEKNSSREEISLLINECEQKLNNLKRVAEKSVGLN